MFEKSQKVFERQIKENCRKVVVYRCFGVIFIMILCFKPKELALLIKILLHVKKQISGSGTDHLHPRNKKPIKKFLVVKH